VRRQGRRCGGSPELGHNHPRIQGLQRLRHSPCHGAATNPNLTKPGYKTTYRIIANDNALGAGLAFYAADALKLKKVAIIDDRTAYGQGVAEVFKRTATSKGMTVVDEQFTTDKATDFMAILTAIKAKAPDAIFYGGMDPQAGPMLRQMEQLGMANVKYFGGDGICTSEIAKLAAGAKTLGNVVCAEGGASLAKMPGGTAWKAKYDKKYPNQFQVYSPYTYDATFLLVDAMKRANSTDPKVYTPEADQVELQGRDHHDPVRTQRRTEEPCTIFMAEPISAATSVMLLGTIRVVVASAATLHRHPRPSRPP
jgi:branched-chain amino acid transport system substrate-binding protein